jgi:type VI secretion system ImpA family protein
MIEVTKMAVPLDGEQPAGQNLEYDPRYLEMDSLAVEVPDSQIGDSKIEGHGPDWKRLNKQCLELWKKTRDLRVATYLVIAQTGIDGLNGFTAAFKLLVFLVAELWDSFYPQLDPADEDDPLERLNILAMLSPEPGAINDPIMFISRFRELKLVPSLPYTVRDMMIATNELEVGTTKGIDPQLLSAELMNLSISEIQERAALAVEAKEQITKLCVEMNGKMKGGYLLNMISLTHEVDRLRNFYDTHLKSFNAAEGTVNNADNAVDVTYEGTVKDTPQSASPLNIVAYQANSRADALLLLRKGSEYFQIHEPNSPIPLLINRALRFSKMSFMDILEDIVPDALSRGRDILGVKEEKNTDSL